MLGIGDALVKNDFQEQRIFLLRCCTFCLLVCTPVSMLTLEHHLSFHYSPKETSTNAYSIPTDNLVGSGQ